jgi:hypothetical protein
MKQHAGQNYNIKIVNKYFKMVEEFKYLGALKTNQSCIMKKLRSD